MQYRSGTRVRTDSHDMGSMGATMSAKHTWTRVVIRMHRHAPSTIVCSNIALSLAADFIYELCTRSRKATPTIANTIMCSCIGSKYLKVLVDHIHCVTHRYESSITSCRGGIADCQAMWQVAQSEQTWKREAKEEDQAVGCDGSIRDQPRLS